MYTTKGSPHKLDTPFRNVFYIALTAWTVIICTIFLWDYYDRRNFLVTNALSSAKATFAKDLAFRRWAAGHGGVYVPLTTETPANPHLNVPERDITTPGGKQLTLMNPAYMNRQVYEIGKNASEAPQGHITSLKPLRPENAPDTWEKAALELFATGVTETSSFETINGAPYFRYMRPLTTEKSCLKCHAHQGYKEGDIRGGISVAIPVANLMAAAQRSSIHHSWVILLLWLIGSGGLWLGLRKLSISSRALRESEERYRQQFQQSRAVTLIIDPASGAIVDANPAACEYYGYPCSTITTLNIADLNTSSPPALAACIKGVLDGSKRQFTTQHRLADGTLRDVEVFSNPLSYRTGMLLHSLVVDVTARLVAEQQLRDKMDFAENLLHNSSTPTFVIDASHTVQIWNRAMEELTGIRADAVVGTQEHWRAFYPSARHCLADIALDGDYDLTSPLYERLSRSRFIQDGLHAEGDYTFAERRCRLIFSAAPIRDRNGTVIAAIETLEDITERMSLEAQLFHAQKMESVGILAGGVAHDFNNVLTVINGYADLLKMTLRNDEENLHYAGEIASSVCRAADMTRSLLAFSGKNEIALQYDDLNLILSAIRKSLGRLIREDITLTITPDTAQLPVYVDRVQIEQILINLVINARDAIGNNGGAITVSTGSIRMSEATSVGNSTIPPGNYVCLAVADSGSGIDTATLERIFEPFFTTKAKGKGTGLGLAIVHSMIAKHHGHIAVTSLLGKGTEFRIFLPVYEGAQKQQSTIAPSVDTDYHGVETILIVEDDDAIMRLLHEVLTRFGYQTILAADGLKALELFNQHGDDIALAIVDVIMPHMNGRDTVEEIRKIRPQLPVIMTSGYTDDIIDRAAIEALQVTFLQKPLKPLDLLAAIGTCLKDAQKDNPLP